MTFINYLGVRFGGGVQVVLTFLKVAAVLAIIGRVRAGAWKRLRIFIRFGRPRSGWGTFGGFLAALAASLVGL